MKNIRERCEKLVRNYRVDHCKCCRNGVFEIDRDSAFTDKLESFALQIRNEVRERCFKIVDNCPKYTCTNRYSTNIILEEMKLHWADDDHLPNKSEWLKENEWSGL